MNLRKPRRPAGGFVHPHQPSDSIPCTRPGCDWACEGGTDDDRADALADHQRSDHGGEW